MTWLARWEQWHLLVLWSAVPVSWVAAAGIEIWRRGGRFQYISPLVEGGRFWLARAVWAAAPDWPILAAALVGAPAVAGLLTLGVLLSRR